MHRWENVVEDVRTFSRGKVDFVQPASSLRMSEYSGELYTPQYFQDNETMAKAGVMGDWAQGQFFSRLGMPSRYFKKLMEEGQYSLVANHANHFLAKSEGHLMIRGRETGNEIYVRGILSSEYTPFDYTDLIDVFDKILGQTSQSYEITNYALSDGSFHMKIVFPRLTSVVGRTVNNEEDAIRVGIHVANSEVGKRMVVVEPMLWRLVCSNGLMGWVPQGNMLRQRHRWLTADEMYGRVVQAVGGALKIGSDAIDMIKASRQKEIQNPLEVIEELAKDNNFSQGLSDSIKSAWAEEPEYSAYGVVNAFTRAARDLDADSRMDLEIFAGKIMRKAVV